MVARGSGASALNPFLAGLRAALREARPIPVASS